MRQWLVLTCFSCRFLLIAGKPINESIIQHGPFVMNTKGALFSAATVILCCLLSAQQFGSATSFQGVSKI